MKLLKKLIILGVIALIVIAVLSVIPIGIKGYEMYREATEAIAISDRIDQLKGDESYVTIDQISPYFLEGVIEAEDRRFYEHNGINLISTTRAMLKNIVAGTTLEGGSSITQQLAKNMYFTFEKLYERKVAELLVAFELEKAFTKTEILEYYCNISYFGEGQYGIKEASIHYYGVEPIALTEPQAMSLVRTLKSPNYYNPNTLP